MSKPRVGIIGPCDLGKTARLLGRPFHEYLSAVQEIGHILSQFDLDVIVLPDNGSTSICARSYKAGGGNKVYGVLPGHIIEEQDSSFDWDLCDEYIVLPSWFHQPAEIIRQATIVLVLAFAPGTLIEMGYTAIYKTDVVVVMREWISDELPKEIIIPGLRYAESTEALKMILRENIKETSIRIYGNQAVFNNSTTSCGL